MYGWDYFKEGDLLVLISFTGRTTEIVETAKIAKNMDVDFLNFNKLLKTIKSHKPTPPMGSNTMQFF